MSTSQDPPEPPGPLDPKGYREKTVSLGLRGRQALRALLDRLDRQEPPARRDLQALLEMLDHPAPDETPAPPGRKESQGPQGVAGPAGPVGPAPEQVFCVPDPNGRPDLLVCSPTPPVP